jgi:hypothetical protein
MIITYSIHFAPLLSSFESPETRVEPVFSIDVKGQMKQNVAPEVSRSIAIDCPFVKGAVTLQINLFQHTGYSSWLMFSVELPSGL